MTTPALPAPILDRLQYLDGLSYDSPAAEQIPSMCPTPLSFKTQMIDNTDFSWTDSPVPVNYGVYRLDCNKKTCPYCAEKNRKKLIAHYCRIYGQFEKVSVLTLTIDPKVFPSIRYSRHFLVDSWSLFRKRINRELKKRDLPSFVYTMMLEKTKVGRYHAHVITNIDLPYRLIQDHWMDSGGGISMYYDRSIQQKDLPRIIGYNVKYIFKNYDATKYERALMNSIGISINSKIQKRKRLEVMAEKLNSEVKEYERVTIDKEGNEKKELKLYIDKQSFEHIDWNYDLSETHVRNQQYDLVYKAPFVAPNYKHRITSGHHVVTYHGDTGEIMREYDRLTRPMKKWLRKKDRLHARRNKIRFKDKKTGTWYDLEYGKDPVKV